MDSASVKPIRALGQTDESLAKILKQYPYFVKSKIPGGVYNGIDEDVQTFGVVYCVVCHKDTPDEAVEEFIKQCYGNDLTAYHAAGSYYTPENQFYQDLYVNNAQDMVPFHPAAQKYLESLGIGDLSSGL